MSQSPHEPAATPPIDAGALDRRDFLRRSATVGVMGGLTWAAPQILSTNPAFASGTEQPCGGLIFSDDFETEADPTPEGPTANYYVVGTGGTLANWVVTAGSVDVIRNRYGALNGNAVDLDGSTQSPGVLELTRSLAVTPGHVYTLTFNLGRNGNKEEKVGVTLGDVYAEFVSPTSGVYTQHTLTYTAGTTGAPDTLVLRFADEGPDPQDNAGPVIDDIAIVETCI